MSAREPIRVARDSSRSQAYWQMCQELGDEEAAARWPRALHVSGVVVAGADHLDGPSYCARRLRVVRRHLVGQVQLGAERRGHFVRAMLSPTAAGDADHAQSGCT